MLDELLYMEHTVRRKSTRTFFLRQFSVFFARGIGLAKGGDKGKLSAPLMHSTPHYNSTRWPPYRDCMPYEKNNVLPHTLTVVRLANM